jgi:hypothetical protein
MYGVIGLTYIGRCYLDHMLYSYILTNIYMNLWKHMSVSNNCKDIDADHKT